MYRDFDWASYKRDSKLEVVDTKGILRGKTVSPSVEIYGLGYGTKNPEMREK